MTDKFLSPERCAAIRARLTNARLDWKLEADADEPCDLLDDFEAVLAAYDQTTLERDQYRQWYEALMQTRMTQPEAALVVLTQRHQEKLDRLVAIAGLVNGYHNDGMTLTAAETLAAVANALGEPFPGPEDAPR